MVEASTFSKIFDQQSKSKTALINVFLLYIFTKFGTR